jgi:hypothetical protein
MATKLFFVLLVLLGIAFFVTMRLGAKRNDDPALPQTNEDRAAYTQSHTPPKFISNLIARISPRLDLPQKEFIFSETALTIYVPPGTAEFRNATFEVTLGCQTPTDCSNVAVRYDAKGNQGEELNLEAQPPKDSTPGRSGKRSIAILSRGGSLTFKCTGAPSCIARLQ